NLKRYKSTHSITLHPISNHSSLLITQACHCGLDPQSHYTNYQKATIVSLEIAKQVRNDDSGACDRPVAKPPRIVIPNLIGDLPILIAY
ncbi:MAG: hypothetical protein FWC69_06545, partial [Defluviitaleaceae bacterium]|nr:hypothetical protein [Defluviitaleaceae bacterium]